MTVATRGALMVVYGLTGGVGMGKSAAAGFLAARGMPVADTDRIAREVVVTGSEALGEIERRFGREVLLPDGSLNRAALAGLAFGDDLKRRDLERILHPRIRDEWQKKVSGWRTGGRKCAVVVIPLLFETSAESLVSKTVCIACSPQSQRNRLRERGWTETESSRRIAAQWPIGRKMEKADYVIWSEGPFLLTELQLARVFGAALKG